MSKYNFTKIFSTEQVASKQDCIDILKNIDQDPQLIIKLNKIKRELSDRFQRSKSNPPVINGKSLNPFVLGIVTYKNSFSDPKQLDPILKASKEFSSLETSAGRIVEDIFPTNFGYETVHTQGHDPFSEIDCLKVNGATANLVALKSGPACINDTMANKIGSAISEHNHLWFERFK